MYRQRMFSSIHLYDLSQSYQFRTIIKPIFVTYVQPHFFLLYISPLAQLIITLKIGQYVQHIPQFILFHTFPKWYPCPLNCYNKILHFEILIYILIEMARSSSQDLILQYFQQSYIVLS